jgi:hypothetical protein
VKRVWKNFADLSIRRLRGYRVEYQELEEGELFFSARLSGLVDEQFDYLCINL